MDKRYQVFVSSTYADLRDEREGVIQALMEMDCIPAGMELFPAADDDQWSFIKRVIDDCDYYLIIIGGRYGSIAADGISYTEKEFQYAHERGIKIIALLHEDPDSIPVNKSDIDPALRPMLKAFRDKVCTNRVVKFWKSPKELPGMVALSLSKTIKTYPAIGWVRANSIASEEALLEVNLLRKENEGLRQQLKTLENRASVQIDNIADFDSSFLVFGTSTTSSRNGGVFTDKWQGMITWRQLFSLISPYLMSHPSNDLIMHEAAQVIGTTMGATGRSKKIDEQLFITIGIQFKALGLVTISYLQTVTGGMGLFWSLTAEGERAMLQERSIKKKAP